MIRSVIKAMTSTPKQVPIPRNGVDYRGKVVLAPMVRSGELPMRLLSLKYGADLVWGPETIDKSMIGTTKHFNSITSTYDYTRMSSNHKHSPNAKESLIYKLCPDQERQRMIFQMGTSNPELAVQASKLVAEHVAGIDVNAGCPKPFSTSSGMGAALLRTPDLLASILRALVKEIGEVYEIGISVKIRLLETEEQTENLVRLLCSTGITGLTIHCRTTPMRPRERAIRDQLRMIARVCKETGVACLMNGDVKDRDEALQLAQEYGVDGGMIATAAEANPSCFRSRDEGGLLIWKEVVNDYMRLALSVDNKFGNTKFSLTQLIHSKSPEYKKACSCRTYRQICEALGLGEMLDTADAVDDRLGLNEPRMDKKAKKQAQNNKSAQAAGGDMATERKISKTQHAPLSERGANAALPVMAV